MSQCRMRRSEASADTRRSYRVCCVPRRPPAPIGLALLLFTACAADGPPVPDPLVVISGPEAFESMQLVDERERVIWRLVASPPGPVNELVYGEVPAGFDQEIPADGGPPRPLTIGEPMRIESVTPRRLFRHEGWVVAGPRLSLEHWEMKLRQPPETPPLDEPAAPSYE